MPNFTTAVAAAVAILDADLLVGQRFARTPQNRTLEAVAFTGSAVVGDAEIEMFIDEIRVGSFFNSKLLVPDNDDLISLESLFIPGSSQLQAVVVDAAATSPVFVMLALEDA